MTDQKTRQATLNSVIDDAIESRLRELHTCLPGIVERFDTTTKRAEIQPAVKRVLVNGELRDMPKLINCPLGVLRFGGFALTAPVKPGNECMIHFTERSLDAWIQFGDVRRPKDIRIHHESDAYFIPVHTSENNSISNYDPDNMVLRNDSNDLKVVFDASGNLTIDAVSTVTLTVPETKINSNVTIEGALTVTGDANFNSNVNIEGDSTANDHISSGTSGATHTHGGVTSGGSQTAPPTGGS